MKPAPQLDFTRALDGVEVGSEVAAGQDYIKRLSELRSEGKIIESVEMVPGGNALWRIHWRKKLP